MNKATRAKRWIEAALEPEIFKRSVKVGLAVGTILALINHGDNIFTLSLEMESMVKIGLTYLVPFSVSTWVSVQIKYN